MASKYQRSVARHGEAAYVDEGLRAYMMQVYNFMTLGLGLTGLVAYAVSMSPALLETLFLSPLRWVVLLAPLGLVFFLSARIRTMSFATAQTVFWIYAGAVGVSLSSIFMIYQGTSIARVFFISASVFGSMSLYGYTTKRDLSGFGHFLRMGVFGLIIASVVNLFLHSSAVQFMVSALGVLIFTGLTAYDTQTIKEMYFDMDSKEVASKKALFGALILYLDFMNIFIHLLQFFGVRRSD